MKKSVRTPLAGALRRAFQQALEAERRQTDSGEVIEEQEEINQSRRKFLENSGKAALLGGLLPAAVPRIFDRALKPKIVIVGGGMAGLSALHTLRKNGLDATIYESSNRTCGRIFSVNNAMGEGTWTEFGGEFIDTDHKDMWDLAKEFNLELVDFEQPSEAKLTKEAYFFEGKHHTHKQLVDAFRTFAPRMKADIDQLPDDISYKTTDPFTRKLDNTSLSKYLGQAGASGWIKKLIQSAYEPEYGLATSVQSSLNLLILMSPDTDNGEFKMFGTSDERYKVKGGNQRIPDALARKYASGIETTRALESIRQQGDQYALHFSGKNEVVMADYVILTVPFPILRTLDVQIGIPANQRQCIDKLGFGTNAKLMLGMQSHFWRSQGYAGLCYSDTGISNGWDNTQLQNREDQTGGLSILFGGPAGVKVGQGTVAQQKDKYLKKWDKIYPGALQQFNGKMARMHWPSYPHARCSYVCPTRGQYTSLVGLEALPVGNVYFAGEHCGGEFAGFMNGAAKSGREAAEAIVNKLK